MNDTFLSGKKIRESTRINGNVTDTAKYIQKNIEETHLAFKKCP